MSKKKLGLFILALSLCLSMRIPVLAQENVESIDKSERMQNKDFENIIVEIQNIKSAHPEYSEDMILEIMNQNHPNSYTWRGKRHWGYLECTYRVRKKIMY